MPLRREHDYLRYRIRSTGYMGEALDKLGIPVLKPIGGHAVYLDARALASHLDPLEYPGQAVAVALFEAGGIRSCEMGTVMFGRRPDGSEAPAAMISSGSRSRAVPTPRATSTT